MTDHIVTSYDQELKGLAGQIAEMGGLAEGLVADAITALVRGDTALAQKVILTDVRLDRLQRSVEEQAIRVIARRQPMAMDLRDIFGALRVSGDLERVGDLAKNIAKRVIAMGGNVLVKRIVIGVEHLSEIALEQLKDVLDAYTSRDAEEALTVRGRDEEIDALYTSLFRELLTYMMEDPRNITFCTHLLFCAKNVERIGDHATNIAETVHFVVTGEQLVDERPKGDSSSSVSTGNGG
ncbi:phosphate signaling complex protein PhoU [Siculibacillus lacustris]|uniref:Phosphate-specific transport system accessory protein PhoU n=1 Tax=Siculibacillus lacustris TaxID=1549641 RepID=A0A4Q9VTB3_9HYPH|nr:phosphate signaling complex protein PhoU [Siculibacillus lacustris]TBW39289.1 phosphate signaling complex protein PhoU [Siculibacillus lacustris]